MEFGEPNANDYTDIVPFFRLATGKEFIQRPGG